MKQSGIEQRKKMSHIDTIFAYTLLLVFGTCTLLLIALSASVYQKNTKRMNQNDERRRAVFEAEESTNGRRSFFYRQIRERVIPPISIPRTGF